MTPSERIPPQNLEAEQSLLGALLIDKDAMIRVADVVKPDDFYRDAHRAIFAAMLALFERREPLDLLSLANKLAEGGKLEQVGGRSALVTLSTIVPTAAHARNYAEIVAKKATLRRLITAAAEITALGFNESEDTPQTLDEAERRLFSVSQQHLKQSFVPIQSVLSEAFDRIDALHREKGKLRGLPTGFTDLDNLLAGLQRSDLVILAARPSVGKTSLALDIARQAAVSGKQPVGIFSLEMSKEQLVDRLICTQANVELWRMRTGKLSDRPDADDFPRIGHAMGLLSEAPIFIDDSAMTNIMEIRAKARRLQMEHGLGLIIVDYLQLMEGRAGSENRVLEVAEITRGLKGIARELNVPVLALSQLSRAVEMSKPAIPKLSHLRESGCLAGETIIIRADTGAPVTIRSLAERERQTPIPVFTLDEQWNVVVRPMTRVFASGRKRVFELRTRSGRTIRASANHPFRKLDGWHRLDTLTAGDRIALPRSLTPTQSPNPLTRDELALLAHLLGDGCVLPRQPIHYTSADPENLATVERIAHERFDITPRRVRQENWWHTYLPSPHHLTHGKPHPITRWFMEIGIAPVHSYEKRVPTAVFACDTAHVAHFLHHLWATDGNISWKRLPGRLPAAAIYYSTTSPKLAHDVQHLLLRLGIPSTMRSVAQGIHRNNYHICVQGRDAQILFLDRVGCAGKRGTIIPELHRSLRAITPNTNTDTIPREAWQVFVQPAKERVGWGWRNVSAALNTQYCGSTLFKHGIGRERMERLATALRQPTLHDLAQSDVYWDEIASITPQDIEEVFDATVPGVHNFLANDIIVHNSIEQDADVVLFIYRKAADRNYRLDDLAPDEKNVAEIHIAKHRNGPTGLVRLFFDDARVCFRNLDRQRERMPVPA